MRVISIDYWLALAALVTTFVPQPGCSQLHDFCVIRSSGRNGRCQLATDCPALFAQLVTRKHTVCGFVGLVEVVCCPEAQNSAKLRLQPVFDTVSEAKCHQYHSPPPDAFEDPTTNTADDPGPPHTLPHASVGGTTAIPNEFPHMALLGYGAHNWLCCGSLISDRFVLTAAHCLASRNGRPDRVRLGLHSIRDSYRPAQYPGGTRHPDGSSVEHRVAQTMTHPQYRMRAFYHDIGLVRLLEPTRLNGLVRPACLAVADVSDANAGAEMVASGWGNTEYRGRPSEQLLKVRLQLFTEAECRRAFGGEDGGGGGGGNRFGRGLYAGIDGRTQMCAGSHTAVRDTCEADSGGPLQRRGPPSDGWSVEFEDEDERPYTILGVTSFGKPCGFVNSPGVYTRVNAYREWIERVVWPDDS